MASTWIAIGVIALIVTGAIYKIVRDKKRGIKCMGCPAARSCAGSRHYTSTPGDDCS